MAATQRNLSTTKDQVVTILDIECSSKTEVKLSEYSIKSSTSVQIYRHLEDPTLNGSDIVANFKLSNAGNDFYRFVKLHSTGFSWNDDELNIKFPLIEFFGQIAE